MHVISQRRYHTDLTDTSGQKKAPVEPSPTEHDICDITGRPHRTEASPDALGHIISSEPAAG